MMMDRQEFLLHYLRELRMLNEGSYVCTREIAEVLAELQKETKK